eukprot:5969408-Amphidinium_carterae.1
MKAQSRQSLHSPKVQDDDCQDTAPDCTWGLKREKEDRSDVESIAIPGGNTITLSNEEEMGVPGRRCEQPSARASK